MNKFNQFQGGKSAPKMVYRFEPVQAAENPDKPEYNMYIYDDVCAKGDFNWWTCKYDDSETSSNHFREELEKIPSNAKINLFINSNGGDVKEGLGIYSQLKRHGATKVGHVDGVCYSVAALILQACDERIMGLGTTALVHNMWMTVSGNAKELRKAADDLDNWMIANRQIFLERSNGKISEEELIQLMEEEKLLTPDECVKYGFADRVDSADSNSGQDETQSGAAESARLNMMQSYISTHNAMQAQLNSLLETIGNKNNVPNNKPANPVKESNDSQERMAAFFNIFN